MILLTLLLPPMTFESFPLPPDQTSRPTPARRARKGAGRPKATKTKAERKIEYISVPKHWFAEPLNHSMKTTVRPPTKKTRRKELLIDVRIPQQIFIDLMKPLDSNDVETFEWEDDETKTALKPTKDGKSFQEFNYTINKPMIVDKLWNLEERDPARRRRQSGKLVSSRRGLGSARLHLSAAAEERGERTDLLAQVTGNVTVKFKVPKKERAMPTLRMQFKVSTLSHRGHIEWATNFAPRTAAALRKQMQEHLRAMVESEEYPTLSTNDGTLLAASSEAVRPQPALRALMPPCPGA